MPLYRDPRRKELLYEVIKVQTCSGEPLEVTTASGTSVYTQPAGMAGDAQQGVARGQQLLGHGQSHAA
jgi:hypothetical protein